MGRVDETITAEALPQLTCDLLLSALNAQLILQRYHGSPAHLFLNSVARTTVQLQAFIPLRVCDSVNFPS